MVRAATERISIGSRNIPLCHIRNPNNPNGGQWLLKYVVSLLNNLPPLRITAAAFQNFKLANSTSCQNINPIPTSDFTSIFGQIICCWLPCQCQYNYRNEIFLLTPQKNPTLISLLPPDHQFIWFPCSHPLPNLTTTCTWGCHTVIPQPCSLTAAGKTTKEWLAMSTVRTSSHPK